MKKSRKILSLALALVLALSLVPMTAVEAFAADNTFTVIYDGNGATGGTAPDNEVYEDSETTHTFTVAGNTGNLTKEGFLFTGWNTAEDGSGIEVSAGTMCSPVWESTGDNTYCITLYAQWKAPVCEIVGGSQYASIADALTAAGENESTIRLLRDVTENITISNNANGDFDADDPQTITLDLNDHVLSGDGTASVITNKGTLTVTDTAVSKTVKYFNDDENTSGLWVWAGSSATTGTHSVTGGCITDGSVSDNGGGIYNHDSAALLVKNCSICGNYAVKLGGGIFSKASAKCVLLDTLVTGNVAGENGGGVYYGAADTCFVAGTLISMADGTAKKVEDIAVGDVVKTFDHESGTVSSAKVYQAFAEQMEPQPTFRLHFEGGMSVHCVASHCFLEKESGKYETFDVSNAGAYVGKHFFAEDGQWHELLGVSVEENAEWHYDIYTERHQNAFADGMLSVPADVSYLLNLYELDENLKADAAQLEADIAAYGLASFDWASENCGMTQEWYEVTSTKYIFIAIGKGLITLKELADIYTTTDDARSQVTVQAPVLAAAPTLLSGGNETPALADFTAGVLTIGSGTKIKNNTADSKASNVYLIDANDDYPCIITLYGDNRTDIDVGVTLADGTGAFTTNGTAADLQFFTSDSDSCYVKFVTDHLELVTAAKTAVSTAKPEADNIKQNGAPVTDDHSILDILTGNTAVSDKVSHIESKVSDAVGLKVELKSVEFASDTKTTVKTATFDVKAMSDDTTPVETYAAENVTFRLPVYVANGEYKTAKVFNGTKELEAAEIKGEDGNQYIEITAPYFTSTASEYSYELLAIDIASTGTTVYAAALELNENLNMNLYIKLDGASLTQDDDEAAKYTIKGTFDDETVTRTEFTYIANKGYRAANIAEIFSYQMTHPVAISIYYGTGDDTVLLKTVEYSAQAYFDSILDICAAESGTTVGTLNKTSLAAFCKAALNYGTEAQSYFSGKTYKSGSSTKTYDVNLTNLANSVLEDADKSFASVIAPSAPATLRSGEVDGITKYKLNVVLGSETAMKLYLTGDVTGVTVTCDNEKTVGTVVQEATGVYSYKISGIKAAELGANYTITVTKGGDSAEITFSPFIYAAAKWDDAALGNLCKAMVNYGNTADALFGVSV